MKKVIIVIVIVFTSILYAQTSEQVLKEYIKKAKKHIVIDIEKVKKVEPKIEYIYQFKENEKLEETLGQPAGITVFNNQLFVTDRKFHNIKIYSMDGKFIRNLGRKGKGPGEFEKPVFINNNSKNLFVYDSKNYRIQMFDKNMNYITSFKAMIPSYASNIYSNESQIYYVNSIPENNNIISSYSLVKPFNKVDNLLFKIPIITNNMKNIIDNHVVMTATVNKQYFAYINNNNRYIFITTGDNLEYVIEVKDYKSDKSKLNSIKEYGKLSPTQTIINYNITAMDVTEKNIVIILNTNKVLIIDKNDFEAKYYLSFTESIASMFIHNNILFGCYDMDAMIFKTIIH